MTATKIIRSAIRLFDHFASIFRPPFDGLWLIILFYYVTCFLLFPQSQVLKGNLPDPDDYMYLVQVMDWLNGHGWYDNIQQRINPPEGAMIHFSRLAQVPMAALMLLFERLGREPKNAAILMAMAYPPLLLAGFFAIMRRVAASFMPKDWTGATAYTALFSTYLIFMFEPGHIDHHGLIIMIVAMALGCTLRMMQKPEDPRWGLAAGAILAVGQTIALEILPWLLLISGWLGLWAIVKGKAAARNGFAFGLALCMTSIPCLLLTRPPGDFFTIDLETYSAVYVFLAGGIAVSFAGVAAMSKNSLMLRMLAGAGGGAVAGGAFLYGFPELIAGPYGAMDPKLAELILKVAEEALPMTKRVNSLSAIFTYLSPILIALGAGLYFLKEAREPARWLWGLLLGLLTAACLLTVFYQARFAGTMGMLAVIPLAVLLQRGWSWITNHCRGVDRVCAKIGLLLMVGPLPAVVLPAFAVEGAFTAPNIFLFPASNDYEDPCNASVLEHVLNDPAGLGNRPRLMVNDIMSGPELLFRTPHSILSAPFFFTSGNMDAYRFFSTPLPAEAEAIARRRHIDLVVSCEVIPAAYLNTGPSQKNAGISSIAGQSFIIDLLVPGSMPGWLREIETPGLKNFDVYEVLPSTDDTEKSHSPE